MTYKIIGAGLSPFARKVLVVANEKGIEFEHDPMVPFGVSDEHKLLHPQGKIPVLLDGDRVIPDPSVICEYLDAQHPEPSLYPSDPYDRARAKWFEEFADSGLTTGAIAFFFENVIKKHFFKQEPDAEALENAATNILPPFFDYLERELGDAEYFVAGRFSIADVGLGSIFGSYAIGGGEVDASRWPRLAAYVERVHGRPSFKALLEENRAGIAAMAEG
jgi:glutathione S-transferase